ncbi:MAG: aspartate carbamoyltransferase catalytic subunit [Maritimibacter sp.]
MSDEEGMVSAEATENLSGWEGILSPGEQVLWQGRPDPGFQMAVGNGGLALFGMFFASFAGFWMVMAAQEPGPFWLFGLPFFLIGSGIILSAVFWATFRRRRSWYTLTDQRGFIATDLPILGRRLKSYPISADTVVEYQPGALASIYFGSEERSGQNGAYLVPVGFERIAEGDHVLGLIYELQQKAKEGGA